MSKNTNIYAGTPILGQLLDFFPKEIFDKSVAKYNSDSAHKTVDTWHQFAFMIYGILTGGASLREIGKNLAIFGPNLAQCRIKSIPARSSISDANGRRDADVFGDFYLRLYAHYAQYLADSYLCMPINGEIDPKLVEVFDSTTVSLFVDTYKNTGRIPENGHVKGGLKAFSKITLSERVPNFICLNDATTNEKKFLDTFRLTPGSFGVFDKGFISYEKYQEWTDAGVYFITRLADNAKFKIIKDYELEFKEEDGLIQDSDIELTYYSKKLKSKQTIVARMVAYIDPANGNKYVYLTNNHTVKALTICLLYKNRWTIEPLFKQIKQNFELNYFLTDSQEGIKTQVWIALILNLIFTVIHKMIKECEDFSTMVKIVAKNTTNYVNFIVFFKDNNVLNRPQKVNIGIVQYNMFVKVKGGGFENSE